MKSMTEKEQLSAQPKRLYRVAQLVQSGTLSYDDLSELIPGILHVNSASDLAIRYLSREGLDIFRYSLEELQQLGHTALLKHQCNFTHTVTYPRLAREFSTNDPHHTAQFFQDWQVKKDEKPLWFFSSAKVLSNSEHICISITPNRIEEFIKRVDKTIEPNEIIEKYFHAFNALTKREKEILTLLGRDSSRKDISDALFIDQKTVKKHCENIYRKLGTSRRIDIYQIVRFFCPS